LVLARATASSRLPGAYDRLALASPPLASHLFLQRVILDFLVASARLETDNFTRGFAAGDFDFFGGISFIYIKKKRKLSNYHIKSKKLKNL
jgi:hypothetical protein